MRSRRIVATGVLAFVLVVSSALPARVHAELEQSTPADGERLDESPAAVILTFTESVSSPPGGMRVLDQDGQRVDDGDVEVDGAAITAGLQADLPDGTYIVDWRAISVDSHPVRGAFTFVVGDGPAADAAAIASVLGDDADRPWHIAAAVARGIAYLGALLTAGVALFMALVEDVEGRAVRRLLLTAALVGSVGLLSTLLLQAELATGLGIGALFRSDVAGDIVGNGVGVAIVVTTLGLLTVVIASHLGGGARRPMLVVGAAAAIGGFAASGHTTETDPEWLATASDVVHAGVGAAWFGGLVLLTLALRRRPEQVTAATVRRFSRLATAAVVVIGAAGSALAWSQVRSLDALTSTTYGALLIAKVGVIVAVALIGLYNRARLVPAVATASSATRARYVLGRTVAVEAAALLGAIALTGILVNVTPARAAVPQSFSATAELGDGRANLVVDPAEAGDTSIDLFVLDDEGNPTELPDGSEVTLDLRLPSADIGPIEAIPFVADPGHYRVDGFVISVAGTWQITVSARVGRFEVQSATFDVPIR